MGRLRRVAQPGRARDRWSGQPGTRADVPQREVDRDRRTRGYATRPTLRASCATAPVGEPHRHASGAARRGHRGHVAAGPLRWRDVLPVYLPYWLDGLAFFATGLIVFYFRPTTAAARATLALGTILGTVLPARERRAVRFWLDRLYFACES